MHIEPGVLNASKVVFANVTAIGTLTPFVPKVFKRPDTIVKVALAAVFFSVFMEMFHLPVGASELHFVGASAVYFTFGFIPTLFGFAIGLALQGLLFEPQDLVHLGVNSLSLMLPLIATHALVGRHFFNGEDRTKVSWTSIVKFDAPYYAGVVAMVGFWLSLGQESTPFYNWLEFAISYLPLVLLEPVFTYFVVRHLKKSEDAPVIRNATVIRELAIA
jgi:cobalt/nickel transport system permease protein